MANHYETTTISPDLPEEALTPGHLSLLRACGFDVENSPAGMCYLFAENGTTMLCEDDASADELVVDGLSDALKERVRDDPYVIEWPTVLQDMLRQSPKGAVKGDEIIARTGFWCDKARQDEFGGVLVRITRDSIVSFNTHDDDLARSIDKAVAPLLVVLAAAEREGSVSRSDMTAVRALHKNLVSLCSTAFDERPTPRKRLAGPRM